MFSRDVGFRWWGHVWTTNVIPFSQKNPTAILEKSRFFRWTAKAGFQRERCWILEGDFGVMTDHFHFSQGFGWLHRPIKWRMMKDLYHLESVFFRAKPRSRGQAFKGYSQDTTAMSFSERFTSSLFKRSIKSDFISKNDRPTKSPQKPPFAKKKKQENTSQQKKTPGKEKKKH